MKLQRLLTQKDVSVHHRVQIGSGVHPASNRMGTAGSFSDQIVKLITNLMPRLRTRVAFIPFRHTSSMRGV